MEQKRRNLKFSSLTIIHYGYTEAGFEIPAFHTTAAQRGRCLIQGEAGCSTRLEYN